MEKMSLSYYILMTPGIHLCPVLFCSLSVLYPYIDSLTQPCLAYIQFIFYILLLLDKLPYISTVMNTSISSIMRATEITKGLEHLS